MNSRYVFGICLIGLAALAGCGGSKPLQDKTRQMLDCKYSEEKNNVTLTAKVLNRVECKRLFGSDALLSHKNPIFPIMIIIDNHCSKNLVLSPRYVELVSTKRQTVTGRLHESTAWENIGVCLNDISAANSLHNARHSLFTSDAVSETIKALEAKQYSAIMQNQAEQKIQHNVKIDELLDSLLLYDPVIIVPNQRAAYCFFVPENQYKPVFKIHLPVQDESTLSYTVQMKKHASTWL